jgi:hypothetical protein
VAPLRVLVERRERLVERVRVDQRAAADAGTGHDQAVLERVDPLDAVAAELRAEQEPLGVERGLGQVLVLEPGAGLEYADPVALLGQPQRGHGPAEPGADDEDVVVELGAGRARVVGRARRGHARPSFFISRKFAVITLA